MAEVLGRYSNQGAVGASARAVLDAVTSNPREESWQAPTLVGTTRVRRLLADELEAMIADYAAGIGCVLLARKYGIAENTVLASLKKVGVEVRRPGVLDLEALDEMALLRGQGWTLSALGEKYGVTRQTVAARLRHSD